MGANLRFTCPVEGCDYTAGFRLGMGEEDDPAAHAERLEILRKEHPEHPAASSQPPSVGVGERFPLDVAYVGDCPDTRQARNGWVAFCVLDKGHAGQHVATDGRTVVEVWD